MLCGYKRVSSIRFGQGPQPSSGVGEKGGEGEEKEEKGRKGRKKEKLDVFLDEHSMYIL